MTAPAATLPLDATAPVHPPHAPLTAHVFRHLKDAETTWRALETVAVTSPYQRFDWIAAYLDAGFEKHAAIRIVALYAGDVTIALLPLTVKSRMGASIAQIIGMPISNMDGLVFDPAYRDRLTPDAIMIMLNAVGQSGIEIDLAAFHCVVENWGGYDNPLMALPHAVAPNRLYFEPLHPSDGEEGHRLPKRRRKNIRYSYRKLESEFGPLRLKRADTAQDVLEIESQFLAQRTRRFAQMGVDNIFAQPAFRKFFTRLASDQVGNGCPALAFHALYAGETLVATAVGAYANTHYSHYMNSTTDGDASRYSIIGVMLTLLVDELRAQGIESFDIGLGDFDYKTEWSTPQTVYDCLLPLNARGRLAAPALFAARALKRTIKQTPALWRAARAAQSRLSAMRRT